MSEDNQPHSSHFFCCMRLYFGNKGNAYGSLTMCHLKQATNNHTEKYILCLKNKILEVGPNFPFCFPEIKQGFSNVIHFFIMLYFFKDKIEAVGAITKVRDLKI